MDQRNLLEEHKKWKESLSPEERQEMEKRSKRLGRVITFVIVIATLIIIMVIK